MKRHRKHKRYRLPPNIEHSKPESPKIAYDDKDYRRKCAKVEKALRVNKLIVALRVLADLRPMGILALGFEIAEHIENTYGIEMSYPSVSQGNTEEGRWN